MHFSHLHHTPFSVTLHTEHERLKIAKQLTERNYSPGDILMKEGEHGDEFFLISKGRCEVYVGGKKVAELRDNDYCGEQALISRGCLR